MLQMSAPNLPLVCSRALVINAFVLYSFKRRFKSLARPIQLGFFIYKDCNLVPRRTL